MVWYSHLFKNFPQFVAIHTVKGFGIVNKAEVDMHSTSCEMPCWIKHKLESRLSVEISITSDMQMTESKEELKRRRTLDESERGE